MVERTEDRERYIFMMTYSRAAKRSMMLMAAILLLMTFTSYKSVAATDGQEDMALTQFVFFYTQGCKDCEGVKEFMAGMDQIYEVTYNGKQFDSRIEVLAFDIGTAQGLENMYRFYAAYDVPEERQFVPSIYIGDVHLLGEEETRRDLIKHIKSGKGLVEASLTEEILNSSQVDVSLSGQSIAGVLTTGLINGFNPCSISMMLFLFSLLLTKKNNVLKLGMAFILGKFMTYLLLGTAFYSILSQLNFDLVNALVKVVLVVIFGGLSLMNFLDFFAAKNEAYGHIRMQLPTGLRKFNHDMMKGLTDGKNEKSLLAVCFLLGVLISAGEFLCTGQIYLATILYVLQNSPGLNMISLTYFVVYCLAFILPLVVITIAVHKSKSYFNLSELVRGNMHIIKLVNAMLFLLFLILVVVLY